MCTGLSSYVSKSFEYGIGPMNWTDAMVGQTTHTVCPHGLRHYPNKIAYGGRKCILQKGNAIWETLRSENFEACEFTQKHIMLRKYCGYAISGVPPIIITTTTTPRPTRRPQMPMPLIREDSPIPFDSPLEPLSIPESDTSRRFAFPISDGLGVNMFIIGSILILAADWFTYLLCWTALCF